MPGFKDSGILDFTVSGVTVQSWNARIWGCRVLWQIKRAVSFFIPLLLGPGVWSLPYGGTGSSGGLEAERPKEDSNSKAQSPCLHPIRQKLWDQSFLRGARLGVEASR